MSGPVRDPYALGAATEMVIRRAFGESALITALKAAPIFDVDEKTLRDMAHKGVIRTVIVGRNTRKFAEADVRAFLAGERLEEVKPCQSTSRRKAASGGTTSGTKVIGIQVLLEQRRAQKRKGSRRAAG